MTIQIPDGFLNNVSLTEQDLKLRIAVVLFQEEIFTLGQAAEFLGIPQLIFQQELAKRKIPIHYDVTEFRRDLEHLNLA